jgi:hypothetical protein
MSERREPFDRAKVGFYMEHRIFEDASLADIAADPLQVAALARMFHTSDRQAGAPVSIPRVNQAWVDRWVEARVIELAPGDCYTVPGMAEAATKRIDKAKAAAAARWGSDAPGNATGNAPGNATGNARTHALRSTVYGLGNETKKRKKRSSQSLADARDPSDVPEIGEEDDPEGTIEAAKPPERTPDKPNSPGLVPDMSRTLIVENVMEGTVEPFELAQDRRADMEWRRANGR